MEIKDFVGDADIKNEADLLMDMLNNVSIITFLNLIVRLIQTEKVVTGDPKVLTFVIFQKPVTKV